MFNSVSEIFGLIGWEFGWAGKPAPKCHFPTHLQEQIPFVWWEMPYFPSGQIALLEERMQPSLLCCHWNTLISHLFFIFTRRDTWGISREEDRLARRCLPFLGPWPSHHVYTMRTSPTAPTRCQWMSLQTLRNGSALPAQRRGFGAAF